MNKFLKRILQPTTVIFSANRGDASSQMQDKPKLQMYQYEIYNEVVKDLISSKGSAGIILSLLLLMRQKIVQLCTFFLGLQIPFIFDVEKCNIDYGLPQK